MVRHVLIVAVACAALLPMLSVVGTSQCAAAAPGPEPDQFARAADDGAGMPAIIAKGDPSLARCTPRPRPLTLDALVTLATTLTDGSSDRVSATITNNSQEPSNASLFSLHCRLAI